MADDEGQQKDIVTPHANDVLCGRGNFVNHHEGNQNFRRLVKAHKKAYVSCPKARKGTYSKIIYHEIRGMKPPGRFLKQDPKTQLWSSIGVKNAIYKTRQALREGAPELVKEMKASEGEKPSKDVKPEAAQSRDAAPEELVAPLPSHASVRPPLPALATGNLPLGLVASAVHPSIAVPHQLGALYNPLLSATLPPIPLGISPILAAAAQIQAQQQAQLLQQNPSVLAELEAQLQQLKNQTQPAPRLDTIPALQQRMQAPPPITPSTPLLAAAAQIQAQQQLQQLQQNPTILAVLEAQLQALKGQSGSNSQQGSAAAAQLSAQLLQPKSENK